ncbi:DUF5710 domain-containing protein [Campylobacter hyointestinalis]|uniref:DUF5710 domain-containing protein n=1 Tax=Campylobacter hyointestinalis TaxID=198 RepID=UPI000CE380B0|nr:DUF5710 domain-containing protein [Campylobacter hyointestinalis]PPB51194.1 hypothetical protein CDQ68_08535 [Campylobacter hyointestinalis subsp. hyointestinalis]PPB65607.1 hypothetical protein CDQ75_08890 [Campylobacter hyointestinalis subsp. hyointestinalis]PPB68059.1 hypothetical protein CDQ77_08555 [Campylobacter hyointestinalis subsp. hyointestinalis]
MPKKRSKIYLFIPYNLKDSAKNLGVRWDIECRQWFVYDDFDMSKLTFLANKDFKPDDFVLEISLALKEAGLIVNKPIIDGKLHRTTVVGDKGSQKSGAYVFYSDGIIAGFIQNFKTGYAGNFKSKNSTNTSNSQIRVLKIEQNGKEQSFVDSLNTKIILEQKSQPQKTDFLDEYKKSAKILYDEYCCANLAKDNHIYLIKKGLKNNYGLKQDVYGNLLIPLRDIDGFFWAVQRIFANGDKMIGVIRNKEQKNKCEQFLAKKSGNFFIFGAKSLDGSKEIFICEGFATAASIYEATGKVVIMGVDIGNLQNVIQAIKEQYFDILITIAADNDVKKELESGVNVGRDQAFLLAKKFNNIRVCLPKFSDDDIKQGFSDFNDIFVKYGKNEVFRQLKENIVSF